MTASQNSVFSLAADSQRIQSKSSSEIDGEEREQVHPLGGSYVPQAGSFLGNRKFEFLHLQRQKQRLQALNLEDSKQRTEFE